MDTGSNAKLIEQLQHYAAKGSTFEIAKAGLLQAGWLEEEIDAAGSQVLFGGAAAAQSADLSPDQQAAVAMSGETISDARRRERDETILAGMVSGNGRNINPYTAKYADKFYDNLGLSWWSIFFINALLVAAILTFKLPPVLQDIFGAAVFGLVAWRFFQRYIRKS